MSKTLVKSEETSKKWSVRKDSVLEDSKIPFSKFILAVRLFGLQCIYKFVSKDDQILSEEVEMDESYFGGKRKGSRGAKYKIPVFGILSLVMYGFKHERIDKSVKFANCKVYINRIEGF